MFHRHYGGSNTMMHPSGPNKMYRNHSVATSSPSMFQEGLSELDSSTSKLTTDNNHFDDKYRKAGGDILNKQTLYWRILPCVILMLLPWIPHERTRWLVSSKRAIVDGLVEDQKGSIKLLDDMTEMMKNLRKEVERLTKDNELSFQEIHRSGKDLPADMESALAGNEEQETIEDGLVKRIERLEKTVQNASRRRLNQRYGSGSHRVLVTVRDDQGERSAFVIETADIMDMPHSIDHFFRMIEKNLWNDLAFVFERNSKVVVATPMTMDDSHAWAGQRFVNNNLTHMAFTEYSATFPPQHYRKYSVAFSGRPGGPNFYINMDDELEFAHEHESTFGVVLEGRDVLHKLYLQMQAAKDVKKMLLTIESIKILEKVADSAQ